MSKYADLFKKSAGKKGTDSEEFSESRPEGGFTILFVDDEPDILKAMMRIFFEENYTILTANNADEALLIMARQKIQLVVSDHRMPGMTGADLLREIKKRWPETIRIMLTGFADILSIMVAVNEGAVFKFITKPWNDEDLRLTVSLALQQYVLISENKQLKEVTKKQQAKIRQYSAVLDDNKSLIGSYLVKSGVLEKEKLAQALKEMERGELLVDTLVRLEMVSETAIVQAFLKYGKIEFIDLKETRVHPSVGKFLPRELCERNRILPIKLDSKKITVAMADPSDIFKCDNIAMMTSMQVVPLLSTTTNILAQLKKLYGERDGELSCDLEGLTDIDPLDEIDIIIVEDDERVNLSELIGSSEIPPIIRVVNAIISEAVRHKASDIHIEPKTKYTVIRYRVDGMLHSKIKIPADYHPATISRIKILAKMDIAERRLPQDGRISVKSGTRLVDIRVSTMPTINGEKVVMRVLDKNASIKSLDELGILEYDLTGINILTKKPQGIIIATGPTGSGKTTMLYSILGSMLQSTKNFETIEDPVEYYLEEASQVFIKEKTGMTFSSILKATLRQDPDVILVGEMRDLETADVAFKAALTGHMVLSTLHTNNSVASITRLIDIGIRPYLIASAIEGIFAQRLVRKICKHCKQEETPDPLILDLLKIPVNTLGGSVSRGKGCDHCDHTGYLGRIGVFELFVMNDEFRQQISTNYKESQLIKMARDAGMHTLIEDGIEKVKAGFTTLDELLRVIGSQSRYEKQCSKCQTMIDANFLFCPLCGNMKSNFCNRCNIPLEEEWSHCPVCGINKADIKALN
ncbi:MAG: Flp pilus assembly complex ATPase component TadA [Proteobacteria bacterium]|nr:Flp pilus assembly complex ATPase component TadA [Pseudomonadota bacterium]MBU1686916.1 Flp pilus assembly complex ATPase component TadA [Pseudomonadota bacterium]